MFSAVWWVVLAREAPAIPIRKKMNRLRAFFGVCVALALVGCGGGGSKPIGGGQQVSKQQVLNLLESGFEGALRLGNDGGGPNAKKPAPKIRRDHDGFGSEPWLHEEFELWVHEETKEGIRGPYFYEDQELTKPAGHDLFLTSEADVFPSIFKKDFRITAGKYAGLSEIMEFTTNENGSGTSRGNGSDITGESWEFTGSWDVDGQGTWSQTVTFADGTKQSFAMVHDGSGIEKITITNPNGITFAMNFNVEDGSGTGTITGAAEGLPATMTWDNNGDGKVVWSDGTETPFTNWDLVP